MLNSLHKFLKVLRAYFTLKSLHFKLQTILEQLYILHTMFSAYLTLWVVNVCIIYFTEQKIWILYLLVVFGS